MRTVVLGLLLATLIAPALAHDWYPSDCCSGRDCKPIACDELESREDGSIVVRDSRTTFSREKIRPSRDTQCHTCIAYGKPLCVFILQGS